MLGNGSQQQHSGDLERNVHSCHNALTGQEGTRTVKVLLGWDQHNYPHGLTRASLSFSETDTRINFIGWGQECIMIEHKASYILDMLLAFYITIRLSACLFTPQAVLRNWTTSTKLVVQNGYC